MGKGGVLRQISRAAWVFSSTLFLFFVFLILLSSMGDFGYSFWEISIYDKMIQTMEICFGVLCLLQIAQYLSARYAVAKGIVPESRWMETAATHVVALSAWLTYAVFYGLAPMSSSASVKLLLSTFLVFTLLAAFRTCTSGNVKEVVKPLWKLAERHVSALALIGGALILYLSFLSHSLSEWDSFNFAQALRRFDLGAHQPHPPGYSLYVFLGKMAFAVSGNPLVALTSVSAISGALCLLPIYAVVKKRYDRQTAVITCLALMSTRMFWLTSEKAITHMLGTFLITLAICLLYLGLAGERRFLLMSWPAVGLALGARPSYFPFLGLWLYGIFRDRDRRRLPMYLTLFACSLLSWLAPTILLTGWERFWELIRRQYVYVSVNEFIGARYGMQPIERFLSMLGGFISFGFGAPTWLMWPQPRPLGFQDILPVSILCLLVALMILGAAPNLRRKWSWKRTFLVLWTVPYFIVVYLISAPLYPRYFLPIIPPIVIALVSTAWSAAKSARGSKGKVNLKGRLLLGLVTALIVFNFLHSSRLAAIIHTTDVPMVQLTQYIKRNYDKNTVVIVFHGYRAFEYHMPGYRYLSAQYDRSQVVEILENLGKTNRTVLITDISIKYVLGPTIERLGLEKVEVARFGMDPQVETEHWLVVLYRLQPAKRQSEQNWTQPGIGPLCCIDFSQLSFC